MDVVNFEFFYLKYSKMVEIVIKLQMLSNMEKEPNSG